MTDVVGARNADKAQGEAQGDVVGEPGAVGRRGVLGRLFGLAVGVATGAAVFKPDAAGATTGTMQYGTHNDAGTAGTDLVTATDNVHIALSVANNGGGWALQAVSQGPSCAFVQSGGGSGSCVNVYSAGDGAGLVLTRSNSAVAGAAIDATSTISGPVYRATSQPQCGEPLYVGTHYGYGAGMQLTLTSTTSAAHVIDATQSGTGAAISAAIVNATSHGNCIKATTTGTGSGVYSDGGARGRGATLVGNVAQLRLAPGSLSSHPPSGAPGDLYVDKSTRLWFCKGGTSWHQLA